MTWNSLTAEDAIYFGQFDCALLYIVCWKHQDYKHLLDV